MRRARSLVPLAATSRPSGVDLRAVALMPNSVGDGDRAEWVIDCRETHLRGLVSYLGYHGIVNGLLVLHPERKRPLRAVQLTAPDPTALPSSDLEGWVPRRAPHIHRIG